MCCEAVCSPRASEASLNLNAEPAWDVCDGCWDSSELCSHKRHVTKSTLVLPVPHPWGLMARLLSLTALWTVERKVEKLGRCCWVQGLGKRWGVTPALRTNQPVHWRGCIQPTGSPSASRPADTAAHLPLSWTSPPSHSHLLPDNRQAPRAFSTGGSWEHYILLHF